MDTPTIDLSSLPTFDLAFNLATNKYDEKQKFEALAIIKERDSKTIVPAPVQQSSGKSSTETKKTVKPPLKGSKAEKIYNLLNAGKSVKEVYEAMNKKTPKSVYFPEIYRIAKMYWPEQYIR